MASQRVLGVTIVLDPMPCTACLGDSLPNVIVPLPTPSYRPVLEPNLTALVDSASHVVTFTFSVTNRDSVPHVLEFRSSMEYDFVVSRSNLGPRVWSWSADRAFAQMLTSRTLAVGETVTYRERWTPTVKGTLFATATLATSSPGALAVASTSLTVP
jgi:hypothetical protein